MVDLHAHLLPGIDDGASDLQEAAAMLRQARDDGVDIVCATPHIVRGVDEKKVVALRSGFEELRGAVDEIDVQVLLGAEVYLHAELGDPRWLREITLNGTGRFLLVEFPMDRIPFNAKDLLSELLRNGIVPILAHPERNVGLQRTPARLESFIWMGILVQINVGSIGGKFGRRVAKVARYFLRNGWAHVLASDAHNSREHSIRLSQGAKMVAELVGEEAAHQLVADNPRRIIEGRGVETLSIELPERGTLGRVWDSWRNVPKSAKRG